MLTSYNETTAYHRLQYTKNSRKQFTVSSFTRRVG